jgi:3-deoxy-manno-octulosonate cytidylyltransferase (CMP-KDO synthetase)
VKGVAVAIIPARYNSARLPGKSLLPLSGIPLVVHVARRAALANLVSRVIIATDDQRIAAAAEQYDIEARLTSPTARSGTDRVAEVAESLDAELIVNVQGDEPLIAPETIDAALRPLIDDPTIQMSTTSEPITDHRDVLDPGVVKVVTDGRGFALYFSRAPVPYIRSSDGCSLANILQNDPRLLVNFRKHSGLYAFRRQFLASFTRMIPSKLEKLESLEQLRVLENGAAIRVVEVDHQSIGVDTLEDYERVKRMIEEKST